MPSAVVGAESLSPSEQPRDASFRPEPSKPWLLALASFLLLFSGSFDTIVSKFMNRQLLSPGPGKEPRYFESPWFQTFTMYIGEFLCLIVYYIDRHIQSKRGKPNTFDFPTSAKSMNKPQCPAYWWIIPTTLDFISTTLINYAFVFTQASTIQMLRNFNVIVTAFLTFLYLRIGLRVHQWLGVSILTCGLVIIGFYALLYPDQNTNYSNMQYLGIIMSVGGTLFSAFQFVFEEKLFRTYYCSPFQAVGLMGFYGIILGTVVLVAGQFIGFEYTSETFYQMSLNEPASRDLVITNCVLVISISIFNGAGLMVTKLGSGLLRTILIAARTFSVWCLELILRWNKFTPLNFIGLLILLVGVAIYNYNFMISRRGSWFGDQRLMRPLVCLGVRDPDAITETELSRSYINADNVVATVERGGKEEI